MKYLLAFAALLSFAVLPTVAQEESASEDSTTLSPEEAKEAKAAKKAAKEEAKARKKLASMKKKRDKAKFKWYKSLDAALKAAKDMNTTCLVVRSDPPNCPYCVKLEEEVFKSGKFKGAKGIGVGYISVTAVPRFNLSMLPSAVIVGPDGKTVGPMLGYKTGRDNVKAFVDALKAAQPSWDALEAELDAKYGETEDGDADGE